MANKRMWARGGIVFGRAIMMVVGLFLSCAGAIAADEPIVPADVIFVTSTGYWEETTDPLTVLDPAGTTAKPDAKAVTAAPDVQRGYYKVIAVRQPEGNAHIFLQQIAAGKDGPTIVSSAELDEFSAMKAYVTDIRPERSDGRSTQPGLFVTVYLKTDPAATDPDPWTVLIDDIGDIKIEPGTN